MAVFKWDRNIREIKDSGFIQSTALSSPNVFSLFCFNGLYKNELSAVKASQARSP